MPIIKKRRSTGRVTLADVARLAGVGSMTVSRALRKPDQVSDKLREKIESAVSELGYVPNLAASALASGAGRTISVVVPSFTEAGCAQMLAGLQSVLQPAGFQLTLSESQRDEERETNMLENLLSASLAAVVLLSTEQSDNTRQWLKNAEIPVVEIGAIREDPIDINIGIDYADAMFNLTRHVIERGYENIGLLCANQEPWVFQQHLHGWHQALLRSHFSPHRVINAAEPANFSTGANLLPEFILAWPETDALICASDELACGVLYECQRRHIRVPSQLAVAGFGNRDVSQVCQPPLTTTAVPFKEIGIQAANALLARLNQQATQATIPVSSVLCKRSSC
ncbi:LacI family DNA-binding transcriptional regulator [Hafnia sp.]|uniref:LacI family DNA-binding transcriptional regulator n=1 Tax=Hafnia sp. TaxID=1873498 RepID=UPI002FC8C63F